MIVLPEIFWQFLLALYILATLLQLVAWWCIFGKLARSNGRGPFPISNGSEVDQSSAIVLPKEETKPVHSSAFSIIICARNEAENLRRYLPAVLAQKLESPWELLVVDDASEDDTPQVLHFFEEKNPDRMRVLRIAKKTSAGKKHALAQGIAAAKHDHILCTDADCEPASPFWLANMAAMLTAKPPTEIVLGYGPCFIQETQLNLWSRFETAFTAAQYFSFALSGMPYMGVGRNLAFKRQVYDRVGGYSAHAHIPSGDDDLLVNAAANARNTRCCLDPDSFVYSRAPSNWSAWLRQKQRHLMAGHAYRWQHKLVLAIMGLSHVGHYFLFCMLMLAATKPEIVVPFFLFRILSIQYIFGKILRLLHGPGLFWRIPWFDALMTLYLGVVVPWCLIWKKKISWRSDHGRSTF